MRPLQFSVPPQPAWGVASSTRVVALGEFQPACDGPSDSFSEAIHDLKHRQDVDPSSFESGLRAIVARDLPEPDRVVCVPGHEGDQHDHLRRLAAAMPGVGVRTLDRDPPIEPTKRIDSDEDRWANVAGTTQVRADVTDETVLVVDDVLASGASLATAASALRTAGAAEVVGAVLGLRVPASVPTTQIAPPGCRTN
jgi:predicted amidophosphoribosyltransferase